MARPSAKSARRSPRKAATAAGAGKKATGTTLKGRARLIKEKAARVARKAAARNSAAKPKASIKALAKARTKARAVAKAATKSAAKKPSVALGQRLKASLKRVTSAKALAKPSVLASAATAKGQQKANGADLNLLTDLLAMAKAAGADAADALFVHGVQVSVAQRLGRREKLERSEGHDLGLRVLVGRRQAMVSTTDFAPQTLREVAERAVAMARAVPEDPFCGIAPEELLARKWPALEMDDGREPTAEALLEKCARGEDAALAIAGITNSEGAEAGWSHTDVALATSNGFAGTYGRGGYSLSVSVLAGQDTGMERDYEWTSAIYEKDMMAPEKVGQRAAKGAVRRLNPRVAKSARVPVIYDPRVSGGLLGHLTGAINGRAIARGTSFLKDRLGKPVFAKGVKIIDDPHRRRGLRSKPFDGEGLPTKRRNIIDNGVLTTWLLDLASAWQLKMAPTGHASRGTSGPPSPSPSNLYLAPGKVTPKALMADIKSGFYVDELIGFGVNGVTGDYSRGAAGFWIENGKLTYPVSGVTVAGNLKDMFASLRPANDLVFKSGMDAPTVRIEGMMVAGQ